MVKHGIAVARYLAKKHGAKFYMENPVGNLCRRPYMRGWEADGVRKQMIHYCAYDHYYHKPSHLWTNLTEQEWQPQGSVKTYEGQGTGLAA